jgi:hypothetical protein
VRVFFALFFRLKRKKIEAPTAMIKPTIIAAMSGGIGFMILTQ